MDWLIQYLVGDAAQEIAPFAALGLALFIGAAYWEARKRRRSERTRMRR